METIRKVNERPILFSGEMVRAILAGRKTQTRRVVMPKHLPFIENAARMYLEGRWDERPLPYGRPGDRLWVQEGYSLSGFRQDAEGEDADAVDRPLVTVRYALDWETRQVRLAEAEGRKLRERVTDRHRPQPGRFMYRSCSRILLEVTGVEVQRIQSITYAEINAEGIPGTDPAALVYAWIGLWDRINAPRGYGWEMNPWVWAVSFRRIV